MNKKKATNIAVAIFDTHKINCLPRCTETVTKHYEVRPLSGITLSTNWFIFIYFIYFDHDLLLCVFEGPTISALLFSAANVLDFASVHKFSFKLIQQYLLEFEKHCLKVKAYSVYSVTSLSCLPSS